MRGARKPAPAHPLPPAANAIDGELRGVVIDADADPALVVEQVVDAIGNGFAQRRSEERRVGKECRL